MREFILFYNPVSGHAAFKKKLDWMIDAFQKRNMILIPYRTQKEGNQDFIEFVCEIQPEGLVAAGGDGTVRAVSSQLTGTEMPMALIPAGTGNLLARNLSIPLDTDAAIRLALHGRLQPIDMVTCTFDDGEERFVVMAGMGLDAQIMESTDSGLKKVIRSGAYAVAAVQNAVPVPFTATITLDDAPPERRQMVMALMGNVGTITAGMTLFPRATPTDGMVDLLLANPGKVVDWARLGAQILTGQEMEGFTLTRARTVLIEADRPVPFELDGDTAGSTRTLRAEVDQAALHVIVPR